VRRQQGGGQRAQCALRFWISSCFKFSSALKFRERGNRASRKVGDPRPGFVQIDWSIQLHDLRVELGSQEQLTDSTQAVLRVVDANLLQLDACQVLIPSRFSIGRLLAISAGGSSPGRQALEHWIHGSEKPR